MQVLSDPDMRNWHMSEVVFGRTVKIVSLIGSLEQFDLANILRRIEVFSKTGLLVIKQGEMWVEFYFRQGQLVCVGPMRANVTLFDRLLQAKLISHQSLPQIKQMLGSSETNETRIALTLINEGYLSREILRAWASLETSQILQAIFSWPSGEIYFEDDCPTPTDRLLIALSISALLENLSSTAFRPSGTGAPSTDGLAYTPGNAAPSTPVTSALVDIVPGGQINAAQLIEQVPAFSQSAGSEKGEGLVSAAQLIEDLPFSSAGSLDAARLIEDTPPPAFASASLAQAAFGPEIDLSASTQVSLIPPQPVHNPLPPVRINTSFMTPDLVLVPVDLSSLRERNPQVQLTPDQWRLFALIDGQTPLQSLCQTLMAPAEQVCVVAGELMAIGLIMPLTPVTGVMNEFASPAMAPSGQYPVAFPPYAPPAASAPASFAMPVETQSQWGNGNNGATFMVGGGWMLSSSPAGQGQPGVAYASAGGYR